MNKKKEKLLLENLENMKSLNELNDFQKMQRLKILYAISKNKEDFLQLNKEFDIDKTKNLFYDLTTPIDLPLYLRIRDSIYMFFWGIKNNVSIFYRIMKRKSMIKRDKKFELNIYRCFNIDELNLLKKMGFDIEDRLYDKDDCIDFSYNLNNFFIDVYEGRKLLEDFDITNEDFDKLDKKIMKIELKHKI